MDTIINFFSEHLLMTGIGGVAIVFILAKIFPNKKIAITVYNIGMGLSSLGRGKLGVKFWRGLRHWGEDTLQVATNNIINGAAHYENKEKLESGGKKVKGIRWDYRSKQAVLFIEGDKVDKDDILKTFEG